MLKAQLRRWRDKYEDRAIGHTANSRVMKNRGKVTELKAIYIKDMSILNSGIEERWVSVFRQGRQPDGSLRKPKYMINLNRVPTMRIIRLDTDMYG